MDSNVKTISGVTNNPLLVKNSESRGVTSGSFNGQKTVRQDEVDNRIMCFSRASELPPVGSIKDHAVRIGVVGLLLLITPAVSVITSTIGVCLCGMWFGIKMHTICERNHLNNDMFKNIAAGSAGLVGVVIGAVCGFVAGVVMMATCIFMILRKLPIFSKDEIPAPVRYEYEAKVLFETAGLSGATLAEYCHEEGIFVDDVMKWRMKCITSRNISGMLKCRLMLMLLAKYKENKDAAENLRRELQRQNAILKTVQVIVKRV
ncbi:MAG: hypothetical protein KAG53_03035 [Endozoicomonadaceae bacterium]|nr:hypothetical protein [Endozoicomonadaceae bacterium]